jgi:hypothetical protein
MLNTFRELRIGGVLVAPFVSYAAVALVLFLLLRYLIGRVPIHRWFDASPIVEVCGYILVLATLVVLF